jgi:hypothetical protein
MINDASSMVHFRSSSRTTPATSSGDFSMTLTTTTHSPQQLMVVWNRLLPDESEGPALISRTALRSPSPVSTPEPRSHIQYTRNYHHHEVHRQDLTITRSYNSMLDGSPPQSRAPGSIARCTYEFCDPTGRPIRQTAARATRHVAGDPPAGPPTGRPPTDSPLCARPVEPRSTAAPITSVARPTTGTAPEPPDELDFTPTTDPITGMTVPAYFAAFFSA